MTRTDAERVLHGSCLERLCELPDASIDAVVTDPPYGLSNVSTSTIVEAVTQWATGNREFIPDARGFMGKAWDAFVPPPAVWDECLRVLKPGGHLLAFAGSRTFDLMGLSIRFAGFEVRDSIAWLYGSGFPKSLDVSKAIDKQRDDKAQVYQVTAWIRAARDAAGVSNREIDEAFGFSGMAGHWTSAKSQPAVPTLDQIPTLLGVLGVTEQDVPEDIRRLLVELNTRKGQPGEAWNDRPITGKADEWRDRTNYALTSRDGFRRDIPATKDAKRWHGWGTALKPAFEPVVVARKPLIGTVARNVLAHGTGAINIDACRIGDIVETWPATRSYGNGSPVAMTSTSGDVVRAQPTGQAPAGRWPSNVMLDEHAARTLDQQEPDTARFFYVAKTSTAERNAGLDGLPADLPVFGDDGGTFQGLSNSKHPQANHHPTVKPLTLMRELVRLVTPPGGIVLDPFLGSGTTACAAILEGFDWIGCELTDEYLPIIAARVAWARNEAAKQPEPLFDTTPHTKRTLTIDDTLQLELDA